MSQNHNINMMDDVVEGSANFDRLVFISVHLGQSTRTSGVSLNKICFNMKECSHFCQPPYELKKP